MSEQQQNDINTVTANLLMNLLKVLAGSDVHLKGESLQAAVHSIQQMALLAQALQNGQVRLVTTSEAAPEITPAEAKIETEDDATKEEQA